MSKEKQTASGRMPWYKTLAWSTRGMSLACNIMVVSYLTYYCTNVLAMPATLVGTLLLVSRLFDGVTDIIAGYIVDNTNTRFGKARPYEICIIFVWLATILMYSCPDLGTTGKVIWIFVTYNLANSVFATMLNASDGVYLGRAAKYDSERTVLVSVNGVLIMVGTIIVTTVFPILMGTIGTQPGGWRTIALIFALPLGAIGIGRFIFVKERTEAVASQSERVPVKTLVKSLKCNPYIFILAASVLFFNWINSMNTVGTYYFQYVVGDVTKASVTGLLSLLTPVALVFMPMILKRLSFSKVVIVGSVLGVIGNVIKGLAGANMGLIILGNLLGVFAALPLNFYATVMAISCMDYSEWKLGERVEGAFSAMNGFASKVGAGLSSVIIGFVMGASGFDGTAAVQSASAMNAIVTLYSWLPAALFVLIIILMSFYKLDGMMPQVTADLEARCHPESTTEDVRE